mmetsp:Transcript_16843/g.35517  ORF Transcript_16843/g.35517 Transcript_16843/m.35517 type:complete len:208 (-) Transcript_16843:545-1168(-)
MRCATAFLRQLSLFLVAQEQSSLGLTWLLEEHAASPRSRLNTKWVATRLVEDASILQQPAHASPERQLRRSCTLQPYLHRPNNDSRRETEQRELGAPQLAPIIITGGAVALLLAREEVAVERLGSPAADSFHTIANELRVPCVDACPGLAHVQLVAHAEVRILARPHGVVAQQREQLHPHGRGARLGERLSDRGGRIRLRVAVDADA